MLKTQERKNIKVVGNNKKGHIVFKKEIIRQIADFKIELKEVRRQENNIIKKITPNPELQVWQKYISKKVI